VSVAALRPAGVVYREEQYFAWWIYALLGVMVALAWLGPFWLHRGGPQPAVAAQGWRLEVPIVLAVGLVLPSTLVFGVLRMTTEVTPTDVRVWFGWVPTYRRFVPIGSVQKIEVVSYRPLADFGGWGIRTGRDGERVLRARGDRGVRLDLADGTRLLIGSQKPEALAVAIERALRPGG